MQGERLFCLGGVRPPVQAMIAFIDDQRDAYGVETITGLYKAEVIHRRGPWRSFEAVEFVTLT